MYSAPGKDLEKIKKGKERSMGPGALENFFIIEKGVFFLSLVTNVGQRKKSESPWSRNLDLRVPRSDALTTEPWRLYGERSCEKTFHHFRETNATGYFFSQLTFIFKGAVFLPRSRS